jgi:hypothetical protein
MMRDWRAVRDELLIFRRIMWPVALDRAKAENPALYATGFLFGICHALDWVLSREVRRPSDTWRKDVDPGKEPEELRVFVTVSGGAKTPSTIEVTDRREAREWLSGEFIRRNAPTGEKT